MSKMQPSTLSYEQQALLYTPSYRHILYLISKDNKTFNGFHWAEMIQLFTGDKEKYKNLGETIRLVMEMSDKGYIKLGGLTTKITLKGKYYRFHTHPLGPITIILALAAIIIALLKK